MVNFLEKPPQRREKPEETLLTSLVFQKLSDIFTLRQGNLPGHITVMGVREMQNGRKTIKRLSNEQALQKLRHFCGYSERSHFETRQKAYALGLWKKDVEELISRLIEEKYLDEERFARQFAGSHFRQKKWGRIKITYALRQRLLSEYCIQAGLREIDEKEYQESLRSLAASKYETLQGRDNDMEKRKRTRDFLLQRGFEPGLVIQVLKEMSIDK